MKKFGKTLLKTFAIALVFGIVAASAFGGVTYFLGEQFDITPFVIREEAYADAPGGEAEETADPGETEAETENASPQEEAG